VKAINTQAGLKTLSGQELVNSFGRFGFSRVSQQGSHVKLRRSLSDGTRQILTVPLHRELDRGTLMAIYRQALRFISERELRPIFYAE